MVGGLKQMKRWIIFNKIVDAFAYIAWSLSLWMLSYYQQLKLLKYKFVEIREGYLMAFWFLIIAAIILFDNSKTELAYEIFKSCCILIGTSIFDMVYNQRGSVREMVPHVMSFAFYQAFAYIVIIMLAKSKKLHGRYAKRLGIIFMITIGILYFVIHCDFLGALVFSCIVDILVGYGYYQRNLSEAKGDDNGKTGNLKIRYKRNIYRVSLCDKIEIEKIKIVLLVKRILRRLYMLIPKNIVLYFVLTLCWVFWGIISYYLGKKYIHPECYALQDVLWELKNSYFTSVVLALMIAGYTQNLEYKKKIVDQHDFYVDVLHKFNCLFRQFIADEMFNYFAFYNELCLENTLDYIEKYTIEEGDFSTDEFKCDLKDILEQLEKIEQEEKSKNFIGSHEPDLIIDIDYTKDIIKRVLMQEVDFELALNSIPSIASNLLDIVSAIRRPWRWDVENDIKILRILASYEQNNIKNDFYYGMHLYGHEFDCKNAKD